MSKTTPLPAFIVNRGYEIRRQEYGGFGRKSVVMTDPTWQMNRMTFGVSMGSKAPAVWKRERKLFRRGPNTPYRKLQSLKFLLTRDRRAVQQFLAAKYPIDLPVTARLSLLSRFIRVTNAVRGYHTLDEILTACDRIFHRAQTEDLVVVEAGAGSGSSTAKLSIATQRAGGRLFVFDSFKGIPANEEQHELLDGRKIQFREGAFRGRLGAVKRRVSEHGAIEVCEFTKGLFEQTLPAFDRPVDVALLDVDLIGSTETCLRHIYPKLRSGGVILSQDGHLRATVELLSDEGFWESVGGPRPIIQGLGEAKLLEIVKP